MTDLALAFKRLDAEMTRAAYVIQQFGVRVGLAFGLSPRDMGIVPALRPQRNRFPYRGRRRRKGRA